MAIAMLLPLFLFMATTVLSSADILQNPDFESPPTNITTNTTNPLLLSPEANAIRGWSFYGTVWYITSGGNISLPGNGHAVQLGQGGKINQTFRANRDYMDYVLTFTLGSENCSNNSTAVNVSAAGRSKVFYLERLYGREMWESRAYFLGSWGDEKETINLEIQSVSTDANHNGSCWPVLDTFLITRIGSPRFYDGNVLANSDFEVGPAFINNSSEGILLNEEPERLNSALQQWSIIGIVKYIDLKHYKIPQGKAAIELISGAPSGVQTFPSLPKGSTYTLEFMIGDANDSCVGDLIVYVQVGMSILNFTLRSNGTGSVQKYSMTFKVELSRTPISFTSFNDTKSTHNVFCGPVIDHIILRRSYGVKPKLNVVFLLSSLVLAFKIIQSHIVM